LALELIGFVLSPTHKAWRETRQPGAVGYCDCRGRIETQRRVNRRRQQSRS
jgi:hypothetical protein